MKENATRTTSEAHNGNPQAASSHGKNATMKTTETIWDTPHTDASGPSRRVVIATCLAGKDSGEVVMHMTPFDEKEYNRGMAILAEMG